MPICTNPECKIEFTPNIHYHKKQKYCSEKCKIRMMNIRGSLVYPKTLEQIEKIKAIANRQQDANEFFKINNKCEVCGSIENLVRHEISYSPLETITLCASCHGILHHRFLKNKQVKPRKLKIFPLMIYQSFPLMIV
jgi:ribosomal protein S14